MENKIKPAQYEPYGLNNPSGNINVVSHLDYFDIFLLENLTGNFSITGSLTVNGELIYSPDVTNNIGGLRSNIFNGIENTITGSNNTIVGSSFSSVENENNIILGGSNNSISGSKSIAIGSYIGINDTGAMVLKDSTFGELESNGNDSLSMYFTGGIFLANKTYINEQLWVTGGNVFVSGYNLTATDNFNLGGSGLFSGDINVLGTAYHTGSRLQNLQNLIDASGSLAQNLFLTGGVLNTGINNLNGITFKKQDIEQTISGLTNFERKITISPNIEIASQYSFLTPALTGYNRFLHNAIGGENFQVDAYGGINLALNGANGTIKDPTGYSTLHTRNSLSVTNDKPTASSVDLLFSVNQSGDAFIKRGIIRDPRVGIPTSWDAGGVSGQLIWDTNYLYICTGWKNGGTTAMYSGWSRVAIGNW